MQSNEAKINGTVYKLVNNIVEEKQTMKEQNYIWEGEQMGWCYVVKYEANKYGARVGLNNGSIVNTMDCDGDYLRSYNYWKNSLVIVNNAN